MLMVLCRFVFESEKRSFAKRIINIVFTVAIEGQPCQSISFVGLTDHYYIGGPKVSPTVGKG